MAEYRLTNPTLPHYFFTVGERNICRIKAPDCRRCSDKQRPSWFFHSQEDLFVILAEEQEETYTAAKESEITHSFFPTHNGLLLVLLLSTYDFHPYLQVGNAQFPPTAYRLLTP